MGYLIIFYMGQNQMKTRQLGQSELYISLIGLGAWAIGGADWQYGWGPQDDEQSIATIHQALDKGINWIDTAPVYGLGHSEKIVGQALKGLSNKPYIFTKCSRIWDEQGNITGSLKAESLRQEVEDSLRRLGVEVIDLYQIHVPDPEEDLIEGWETLSALQQEGKIRYLGVSNFSIEQMERVHNIAPITANQPPYSIIRPEIENDILPYTHNNQIGTIIYSPLQNGLLSGKMTRERVENFPESDWRSRSRFFREPHFTHNLTIVDKLGELAQNHGVTTAEIAIAWTLRRPEVTGAIVGARNPQQINGIVGASDVALTESDIQQIANLIANR